MTSYLQIGRVRIGPPTEWHEGLGDPVTNLGGAAIPAPRQALRHQIAVATYAADGASDTVSDRLRLRRQLRSLLNNTPLKLQSYLYVLYSDDPENSGWYVPDFGQLVDLDGSSGLATGVWKLEQVAWIMAGHRRTNKEGRNVWMKDLRTGQFPRDALRQLYSTDFSALPSLTLSPFPHGAVKPRNAVSGQVLLTNSLPTGRDGGVCSVVSGLPDLACCSYERAESALNLSDVIVYDMRGRSVVNYVVNPSFENDIVGLAPANWENERSGTTAVFQVQNGWAFAGSQSLRITATAGGTIQAMPQATHGDHTLDLPVIAGVTYTVSFYCNFLVAPTGGFVQMDFFNNVGGSLASFTSPTGPLAATGVQRISLTETAPANAVSCQVSLVGDARPGTVDMYIDAVMFMPGSAPATYIDGDAVGYIYTAGAGGSLSVGPGEEISGPDWPWNWLTAGQPSDCPVLDNGLVRVRYDSTHTPGFQVDIWNGSTWLGQGKMCIQRRGDVTGFCDTWIAASLMEYTPDRAVMVCTLANSADSSSAEQVFITLQRGELGATFECYPALKANGITRSDCALAWTPALGGEWAIGGILADLNQSAVKIDGQGSGSWTPSPPAASQNSGPSPAVIAATAGTGAGPGRSSNFSTSFTNLGAANFTSSENWVAILRSPGTYNVVGPYQHALVLQQAADVRLAYASDSTAYGVGADTYQAISQNAAGYMQLQVAFGATSSDQINEAETIRNTGSITTSQVADATASGSLCAKDTQTTEAAHTLSKNPTNLLQGRYRVLARCKVDSGATGTFRAGTGAQAGSLVTTTATTWSWLDLGDLTAAAADQFTINAWRSAGGSGSVYIDRVELVLTEDRVRGVAIYSGARDAGQAALQDSRMLGALVAR